MPSGRWFLTASLFSLPCLFIVNLIEHAAQRLVVRHHFTQFPQFAGIVRLWNPEFYVSVHRVFVVKMFQKAFPLALLIELRIVGESKLYATAEHLVGGEVAVCLCHYASLDAPWGMGCGGTMVLNCLPHYLQLLGGEPAF